MHFAVGHHIRGVDFRLKQLLRRSKVTLFFWEQGCLRRT